MLRLQVPRSARFYLLAAVAVTTLLYAGQWLATQYEPDSSLVLWGRTTYGSGHGDVEARQEDWSKGKQKTRDGEYEEEDEEEDVGSDKAAEPPVKTLSGCFCNANGSNAPDDCPFMLNRTAYLLHRPERDPAHEPYTPCLLVDEYLGEWYVQPAHSLLLTVHNHEATVQKSITKMVELAGESFELIIVLDGCEDASEANTLATIEPIIKGCKRKSLGEKVEGCANAELVHVRVIRLKHGLFETSANNIGLLAAKGKYATIIQDDQFMAEKGYNAKLAAALRLNDDLYAVSARCGHTKYSRGACDDCNLIGRCGAAVDRPLSMSASERCSVYVRDTVNRGPLTVRLDRMQQLGYFDEYHFVLEDDDHDLSSRAYFWYGWKAAVLPLDFEAPLSLGATRRGRSAEASQYLEWRRHRFGGYQSSFLRTVKIGAEGVSDSVRPHLHDETRPIPFNCEEDGWWLKVPHDLDAVIDQATPL